MNARNIIFITMTILFFYGCKVLPTSHLVTISNWSNYEDVSKSYDEIALSKTTIEDLKKIGFHPSVTPNVKILNYLDIINIFMPKDNIIVAKEVQECIDAKNDCYAYQISLEDIHQERYGNAFLDVLGFRKYSNTTGWRFEATILIKNETVIYKMKNSQPKILSKEEKKIPLGPFQNAESIIQGTVR